MAKEIERKFLVKNDSYKAIAVEKTEICQGYISLRKEGVVRVRTKNNRAFLTVKGTNQGAVRNEWEYEIPYSDACEMLESKNITEGTVIEKTRYIVPFGNHIWEIDEFHGSYNGLLIAEIELESENEQFERPDFVGEEVTDDARYYNSSLSAGSSRF